MTFKELKKRGGKTDSKCVCAYTQKVKITNSTHDQYGILTLIPVKTF